MDQPIFLIIVFVFIAIVIIGMSFSKKARIKRKLKNAEIRGLTEFKDGEIAKVVGKVEFIDKPLISPLSKRECSYYYVHVQQRVSSGKSSHWKTIIEEEESCKFLIRDGSKHAFINDKNIKSYIVQDKKYSSGIFNDATKDLEKYLNSKGIKSEGLLGINKRLRYKEGVLERGEEIAVFGKGEWKDVNKLNLPEKYGRVLEISSTHEEAIYLSDDPDTTIRGAY